MVCLIRWYTVISSLFPAGQYPRLPGGQEMYLLFNSDIVNYLLKTTGGEAGGLILLFL